MRGSWRHNLASHVDRLQGWVRVDKQLMADLHPIILTAIQFGDTDQIFFISNQALIDNFEASLQRGTDWYERYVVIVKDVIVVFIVAYVCRMTFVAAEVQ